MKFKSRGFEIIIIKLTNDYNASQEYEYRIYKNGRLIEKNIDYFHSMKEAESYVRSILADYKEYRNYRRNKTKELH